MHISVNVTLCSFHPRLYSLSHSFDINIILYRRNINVTMVRVKCTDAVILIYAANDPSTAVTAFLWIYSKMLCF